MITTSQRKLKMFDFVRQCFQTDIFGFCSRKGETKYADFGSEERGKGGVGVEIKDLEWDADIDALTEMEYNLVAEQPKGIKLELQEPEAFESPRSAEIKKIDGDLKDTNKTEDQSMDIKNHNELEDLISDEKNDDDENS